MSKKWFQLSEQGAGAKRLLLTKYIYQFLGEFPVRIIAFFVALIVFIKAKAVSYTHLTLPTIA